VGTSWQLGPTMDIREDLDIITDHGRFSSSCFLTRAQGSTGAYPRNILPSQAGSLWTRPAAAHGFATCCVAGPEVWHVGLLTKNICIVLRRGLFVLRCLLG
jgi:hypothetical protein